MKTYVKNGYGKRVGWTDTFSQQGESRHNVEKENCTSGTESSMRQMPMTTEMTTLHRTSPLAWHCTLRYTHKYIHWERASWARTVLFLAHFIHTHIGSSSSLVRTPLMIITMVIHVVVSSTWPTPLSTSKLSSCPSSSSATSSSRSSTRRSWKTCATPRPTGVRAPTTSSTSPHLVLYVVHESGGDSIKSPSCFSTIFLGSSTQTTWSSRFIRSHFGSSHFLFERARCLSRARAFLVLFLSKCLQPSFVFSHLLSWHVRAMEQICQYLHYQPPLRILVLLMVFFLTLKGQDTDDASLSNSTVACVSFYLLLLTIRIACMTISTRRPTKKIDPPGSASPPQVAQSFRQASVSSCPSWVNTKRTRMEGENMRRWWQVFTSGCPAGCLCHTHKSVNHKKHTIPAKPNLKIISRRILLGWFWSINSDLRSCSKIRQQKTFFRLWWPFTPLASLFSLDDVFFVSCHQIFVTRPKEKKGSIKWEKKNKEMKRGIRWFSAMKKNWRTIEAKKPEIINNWKNKRLKERYLKNIIFLHQDLFVQKKKEQKKERWLDAPDVPRARSMTTECRMRSSTHVKKARRVWCKNQFLYFLEEIQMIIFEQFLFKLCQKSICLRIVSGGNNKKKTENSKDNWKMEKSFFSKKKEENQKGDRRSLILFKRTFFLERRYLRKYIFNEKHKKEIIKQLSEKLEKDIFQNRKMLPQREFCTKLDFFFCKKKCGKGCFFKVFCQEKRIFPRSSRNSDFSHGDWAGCFGALQRQSQLASVCTLSACVVWSCMRRCRAQECKRLPMARRASASTREMCLIHSVLCRRHSPMVVRSLTRWSLENFGAIFNSNGILT